MVGENTGDVKKWKEKVKLCPGNAREQVSCNGQEGMRGGREMLSSSVCRFPPNTVPNLQCFKPSSRLEAYFRTVHPHPLNLAAHCKGPPTVHLVQG
jgi:hypothetical protein